MNNTYDLILAGGGLAGLSLAVHLAHSPLKDMRILVVDQEAKNKNDHTWCYWSTHPSLFDKIAFRRWSKIRFVGPDYDNIIPLDPYDYKMIRGSDFYSYARQTTINMPNIEFRQEKIDSIQDGDDYAQITTPSGSYRAHWVIDSTFRPGEIVQIPEHYHYLKQHFKGWEISTSRPAFDPDVPSMFDFRTSQNGAMRFIYVLPFSETQALVEYTLFSSNLLPEEEYKQGILDYLKNILKLESYTIDAEENGQIPMTDHPFPRLLGKRILAAGTKGGRVKPSTGYAFLRIQQDSQAIVASLLKNRHPFGIPVTPTRYQFFDSIMLEVMSHYPNNMEAIFTSLFKNNPINRLFRFLDEEGGWPENLSLLASVPIWPFLISSIRFLYRKIAR